MNSIGTKIFGVLILLALTACSTANRMAFIAGIDRSNGRFCEYVANEDGTISKRNCVFERKPTNCVTTGQRIGDQYTENTKCD